MAGKFVLKGGGKGGFMFNLKAANGRVVLTSETYSSRGAALNGIESVRENAGDDGRYERRAGKNGQPFFVLKARNLEVIGRSEMYASKSSMELGIASVKANAASALLVDLTPG